MAVKIHPESEENFQEEFSKPHKPPIWLFWKSRRYVVILMMFFGFINCYALRVNLSVAIVAMTQLYNVTSPNGTIVTQRDFDWDTKMQGYLLGSFFYGYIFTQMVGGYLCVRFGGKPVFAIGIGGASILTLLSPLMARINVYLFLAVRILEGIFEGVIMPCNHALISTWVTPLERSRAVTVTLSGTHLGTVLSLPLSSLLATYLGWDSIFYVFGAVGCLWTILWILLVSNTPEEDPRISKNELIFITESLKATAKDKSALTIPWKSIVTSRPAWAMAVGVTCEIWGYYTLLTQLPKFMKYCLNFDLNGAGAMSAIPNISAAIILLLAGHLADRLASKKLLTVSQIRRTFVGIGFSAQFIFLIASVHWMSKFGTTFCLSVAVGFGGFAMTTFSSNSLDLSPNYGTLIVAMGNTLATLPGIVSPILTGYIVTDETSIEQWRIIFYVTACIYLFGSIVYCCFSSGELQPWDSPKINKPDKSSSNNTSSSTNVSHVNRSFDPEER